MGIIGNPINSDPYKLTNTVKLLQMKRVDCEGEGDEVPGVGLSVHRLVDEVVDASPEVTEHGHHVAEEVVADRHLGTKCQK